jgi:DNA-binding SARP family transcriptional activator/predicted ATPase
MTRLSLKLFGSFRLTLDGRVIDAIESDKARALLAYLAVECDQPHPREKLVGLFWPEQDNEHARGSLSQALYHLRGILGDRPLTGQLPEKGSIQSRKPYLLVSPQDIRLNPDSDIETDVAEFLTLLKTCAAHSHPFTKPCDDCLIHFQDACELYTGDFLDGFYVPKSLAFEEWATILREKLRLDMMAALEQLVVAFEGQGELDQALEYALRMVQLDELGEAGNLHLIRLLALSGRRGAAMAHYASFHHTLAIQLGAEPGMDANTLYQHLRNEEAGTDVGNLPASLAPMIGRKRELDDLWGMLRDPKHRLICVLGQGGCGKTRLALEACYRQRYYFRDGVYFVPLSALGPGSSLLAAIAEGMGFTFSGFGDPKRQLLDYLRHKKVLLLLDSFEPVVESAGLVAEMLADSEASKVLVTSRIRLNISEESLYPLEGMCVPPEDIETGQILDYSSAELFLEAAHRVKPGYTPDSLENIAKICRLVDGMPLSLLLASTWVTEFSTHDIAEQISRSLDFLTVEWADLPERQRSLRATFDYSWKLLNSSEQAVSMGLAVFRNAFTAQAAIKVADASPQLLHALMGKSLLSRTAEGLYQMHDLVHQFANELLEQNPEFAQEIHTRYSDYYLEALVEWGKGFKSAQQSKTLKVMEQEVENMRAAWRWAVATENWSGIAGSVNAIYRYADLTFRFQEGENSCRSVLKRLPSTSYSHLFSTVIVWSAHFQRRMDQTENARQMLEEELVRLDALQLLGGDFRSEKGQVLFELGELYLYSNREAAKRYYQQSLEILEVLGDNENIGKTLSVLGEVFHHAGDYNEACRLLARALPLLQAVGEPRQLAYNLRRLGFSMIRQGRMDEGESYITQAIEIRTQIGDLSGAAESQEDYGVVLVWHGRFLEANELFNQCLLTYEALGMNAQAAWIESVLGCLHNYIRQYDRARVNGLRCIQIASQMNFRREMGLGYVCLGQADLGEGEYAAAHIHFLRALEVEKSIPQADELAYTLGHLALSELGMGQVEQARLHLCEALEINRKTQGMLSAIICLPVAAMMLARMGRIEKAIEVQAMILRHPAVANAHWYDDTCWQHIDNLANHLSPSEVNVARENGRQRDLHHTLEELRVEFSTEGESD